jgi:hypothetical protein
MNTFSEKTIPLTGSSQSRIVKKLRRMGIKEIDIEEDLPPDVHGMPDGFVAYGRGGIDPNDQLVVIGGWNGSSQGHPPSIHDGFYWGISANGELYMRGRAGVDLLEILDMAELEYLLQLILGLL